MGSCDRFLAPGGIAGLQILSECFYADKERITLLVTHHAIRKIICVAHEDCGYYRDRYPGVDDLFPRQLEDLRTVERACTIGSAAWMLSWCMQA